MIRVDDYLGSQKIYAKFVQGKDNGYQHFFHCCVIDLIIHQSLASIMDDVRELAFMLSQDRTQSIIGCITLDFKWQRLVKRLYDGSRR
jgi:hypothetical protein